VKCSKCGFVSYPGLAQCRKCGASFVPAPLPRSSAAKTHPIAPPEPASQHEEEAISPPSSSGDPSQHVAGDEPPPDNAAPPRSENLELGFVPDLREPTAETTPPSELQEPAPWRQELSERVQNFRQRRARLRNEPPPERNLDFEFERGETGVLPETDMEKILEFPPDAPALDADLAAPVALEDDLQRSEAGAPEQSDEGSAVLDAGLPEPDESTLEPALPTDVPVEIVMGSAEIGGAGASSGLEWEDFPVAALGRRFLAGLVDGLVLLLAGGLFAIVFWRAGGHLTPVPVNLAVVAFIAVFFVWAYFGVFTAFTFSTPGLACMGIEIRNMEGWPPAPRESLLRAFGYLVSLSAFMMGFLWALVDAEGLTWHDRISGTFLTPVHGEAAAEAGELIP